MATRFTSSASLPLSRLWPSTAKRSRDSRPEKEVVGLFDQHREPLLRYLSSFGLSVQDGEDVVQETFLALFRHLQEGKDRSNLRGWLFRVAHNLGLKRRLLNRLDGAGEPGLAVEEPGAGPEDQAVEGETRRRLLAVVAALDEQDRRCLFLRAEGLKYREIAGILEISLGSVSQSLARSLGKMTRSVR